VSQNTQTRSILKRNCTAVS